MKKISISVILFAILLTSCSSNVPAPSTLPANTATPTSTFTPQPTQTATPQPTQTVLPTLAPFLDMSKFRLVTVNAITPIDTISVDPLFAGQMDYWVVGDEGFIARWGIGSPTYVDSPAGRRNLYDVDFVAPDDGWVVGEDEVILHWNGDEWEISKPPVDSGGPYSYNLYSVTFFSKNDGWAGGCIGSEGGQYFLVYHWDGAIWSEVSLSEERELWACVHDIVALSSDNVWMIGTGRDAGKDYGITMHWNGVDWERRSELDSYNIHSMSALSPDNIWAMTRYGEVLNWNGTEWREKAEVDFSNLQSAPVIFARASDDIFVAGNKIFHWDGINWTEVSSNSNLPVDMRIVDIVEGGFSEGGNPFIYMLDSSGILYWFSKESFR